MLLNQVEYSSALQKGFDREVFHASHEMPTSIEPFIHVGSLSQARMRGRVVLRFLSSAKNFKRLRDTGRNQWDIKTLERFFNKGFDGIVYLNRVEGISGEAFAAAHEKSKDFDTMTDKAFRKLFPQAEDSYIIFDPFSLRYIDVTFPKGKPA